MSGTLLFAVACIYGYVAFEYFLTSRYGMCIAFLAYAAANIGFMWDLRFGK